MTAFQLTPVQNAAREATCTPRNGRLFVQSTPSLPCVESYPTVSTAPFILYLRRIHFWPCSLRRPTIHRKTNTQRPDRRKRYEIQRRNHDQILYKLPAPVWKVCRLRIRSFEPRS